MMKTYFSHREALTIPHTFLSPASVSHESPLLSVSGLQVKLALRHRALLSERTRGYCGKMRRRTIGE